jgi:hypothetical protein
VEASTILTCQVFVFIQISAAVAEPAPPGWE